MSVATDAQMQSFSDSDLRPFAEILRNMFARAASSRARIGDVFIRGGSNSRWNDARDDGPPHLLQSGNSASPDDMLNFNSILYKLNQLKTGTFASVEEANEFAAQWVVLERACVRALEVK